MNRPTAARVAQALGGVPIGRDSVLVDGWRVVFVSPVGVVRYGPVVLGRVGDPGLALAFRRAVRRVAA